MADYAYRALTKDFIDTTHGGVFWSVKPDGSPDVSKKQIYGEGFAMYAFSEYAIALKEVRGDNQGASAALAVALLVPGIREIDADLVERTVGDFVFEHFHCIVVIEARVLRVIAGERIQ